MKESVASNFKNNKEIGEKDYTETYIKLSFVFFGMSSLNTWNTILSSLDFYIRNFDNHSPSFTFPLVRCIVCIFFQFLFLIRKQWFSIKKMMILSYIGDIMIIICLPLCVIFMEKSISYYICCLLISFLGLCDAALYNNLYELLSRFPKENLIYKNTGQGFSGLTICLIRFITIFSSTRFNIDENQRKTYELITFYVLNVLTSIFSIVLILVLHTKKSFISRFENDQGDGSHIKLLDSESNLTINNGEKNSYSVAELNVKEKVNFLEVIDDISIFCFFIFINAFINQSLYPGCALTMNYFNLEDYLKPNTIVFIFNLSDTIGRYIPKKFQMKEKHLKYLTFFRFVFFLTYPILNIVQKKDMNDNFLSMIVLLNLIIFSVTNGLNASNCYMICFDQVKKKYMDKFGAALGSFLSTGTLIGSLLAILVVEKYFL